MYILSNPAQNKVWGATQKHVYSTKMSTLSYHHYDVHINIVYIIIVFNFNVPSRVWLIIWWWWFYKATNQLKSIKIMYNFSCRYIVIIIIENIKINLNGSLKNIVSLYFFSKVSVHNFFLIFWNSLQIRLVTHVFWPSLCN